MISLTEFLRTAPKPFLSRILARQGQSQGLRAANLMLTEAYSLVTEENRIESLLAALSDEWLLLVGCVYSTGGRGFGESEVLRLSGKDGFEEAIRQLNTYAFEFLLCTRDGETKTWQGFSDFAPKVFEHIRKRLFSLADDKRVSWIDYRYYLISHLGLLLARIKQGGMKITQQGDLYRKDLLAIGAAFTHSQNLSLAIPQEETLFLLRFLCEEAYVKEEDGELFLSTEGKELSGMTSNEAAKLIWSWWTTQRLKGGGSELEFLVSDQTLTVESLSQFMWSHQGAKGKPIAVAKSGHTWEVLPRALQELWLLGVVDLGMIKGRVSQVKWNEKWFQLLTQSLENQSLLLPENEFPRGLPNLEAMIPLRSELCFQFQINLCAQRLLEGQVIGFTFSKESVVRGFQAGLDEQTFIKLLNWLSFEGAAQKALLGWAASYSTTLFREVLLLRVREERLWKELDAIADFQALIEESIPNYGFAIPKENRERITQMLFSFGYIPGEEVLRLVDLLPVQLESTAGSLGDAWHFPNPPTGEIIFLDRAPPEIYPTNAKYGREQKDSDGLDKINILEFAILSQKSLELILEVDLRKRILVKPLVLLKNKEPIKFVAIELESGHRREYLLQEVKSLRPLD